jgi:MoaA/NifB/PqqE/SkfB family radical SAM enzyme
MENGVNGVPSEIELKRFVLPPPRYIGLEVTDRCNLRCPMCHFHGRKSWSESAAKGDMRLEVIDLLAPVMRTAHVVWLRGPGEPLLLDGFFDYVDKCHEYNPDIHVQTVSNGTLLSERNARLLVEKHVHTIEFSIDGTIQYGHVGGGADVDRVKEHVRRLVRLKREYNVAEPHINVSFVAMRDNLCELPGLIEFAAEIGAKVRIQPLFPASEAQRDQNILRHLDYTLRILDECKSKAERLGVVIIDKDLADSLAQLPGKCEMPNDWLWVTPDGVLAPCCHGLTIERSIYEENLSVAEVWNSSTMCRLRWELATRNYNDICRRCVLISNTAEGLERAISPYSFEQAIELLEHRIAHLEDRNQYLESHIEAIRQGKVMRVLRFVDRLLGRS